MDHQEPFSQMIAAIQEQTEVISKMMDEKIQKSEDRMMSKIVESETRVKVYLENQVSKRIDALFDGYKLTHEKQWELERALEDLTPRVARLENAG